MNYNSFIKILLFVAIIITACICCIKPQMHANVLVTDFSYMVTEQDYKPQETTKNEVIATVSREDLQKPKPVSQTVSEPVTQKVEQQKVETPKTQKVNRVQTPKAETKKVEAPKTVAKTNSKSAPKTQKIQTQSKPQTKTMTQQQEEIAWNVWRSNLQNQIMKDSRLPDVQNGIVFKFTFTVDKYGKVSNVKTWSLNPSYTPMAIQYIAPVIRGYQGHSILDFPNGSNRVITNVEGGFKVSNTSKYSSPTDYNDTETVRR